MALTADQQAALEGVAGRALTPGEALALPSFVETRNDAGAAALLSVGRTKLVPRQITARGVRAVLPIVQAVRFLTLLRDIASADTAPAWLTTILTQMGVPEADQFAYMDTFASGHAWLLQEAGIDLGSPTTRGMLDIIAASDPAAFGASVATLKDLAVVDDPIPFGHVSDALNKLETR